VSEFRKLSVWRKSQALVLNVHNVVITIRGVNYGSLRNQMLRAAMSITTNIVEGSGQESRKDFGRFLRIALNSTTELEYHLLLAKDFKVITPAQWIFLSGQAIEVRKMLHGLLSTVLKSLPAASHAKPNSQQRPAYRAPYDRTRG
jgi:four helix bundle protein